MRSRLLFTESVGCRLIRPYWVTKPCLELPALTKLVSAACSLMYIHSSALRDAPACPPYLGRRCFHTAGSLRLVDGPWFASVRRFLPFQRSLRQNFLRVWSALLSLSCLHAGHGRSLMWLCYYQQICQGTQN